LNVLFKEAVREKEKLEEFEPISISAFITRLNFVRILYYVKLFVCENVDLILCRTI